jgi:hypothetical protein
MIAGQGRYQSQPLPRGFLLVPIAQGQDDVAEAQ